MNNEQLKLNATEEQIIKNGEDTYFAILVCVFKKTKKYNTHLSA